MLWWLARKSWVSSGFFAVLDRFLKMRDDGSGAGCHDGEVDERDVVSKPEMLASISLPFVEARACLMSHAVLRIQD